MSLLSTQAIELTAVEELRRRFSEEFNDNESMPTDGNNNRRSLIAQKSDIHRLQTENWWLLTFLRNYDFDVDVTFVALVDCLKWRLHFNVDHLNILELQPLLDRQFIYIHGVNIDDHSILWFNVRSHKKGDIATQKLLVYWLERYSMETQSSPLVIVLNLNGAGIQNIDFDMVKFLVNCLKYYFPQMLVYMLVYDIPFILNAAWRLVKSWLDPAAQKMIVFVGKTTIQQYIDVDNLPKAMGGNDEFIFTMDNLADPVGRQH